MRLKSRRALLRFVLLFVVPAIALVAGGHYWVKNTRYVATENAYIKAHHLAISADIDGRAKKLIERGVASRAKYDEAERNLTQARQATRTIGQKIQQVKARLGGQLDIPAERHPMFLEVLARRQQAALNLRRTRIVAPADGIVGRVSLQAGEYVEEGKAVLPIVQAGENWIEANLKETQLTYVRPGQSARILIDAYPDQEWTAKVISISPSTGAELSVLPPQNASGNWVKVVQRVPVRLEFGRVHDGLPLRAGMTVSVSIDTERDRSLFRMMNSALADITGK
ncbi:MAG: HlyD family secretion protein [Alphaproteobacteria bacterium]|nr:HlyD family secretion protein [Alphaproteobacteria bacterium]